MLARLAFIICLFMTVAAPALAQRAQLGPQTTYSAADIAGAVRNSGLNPTLSRYADQMGNLGRFESGGNAGIYNGSCCTGIFQLNRTNLRSYGLTPEQYANMPLQEQTNIWADLTNRSMNSGAVRQLQQMEASGQTFDGRPVDGAMIASCIQLGTGNCQQMLSSGRCSGFQDSNGTSICDMADRMRDPNAQPQQNASEQRPGQQNGQNGNASSGGLSGSGDSAVSDCWACDAVAIAFTITDRVSRQLVGELYRPAIVLMGLIFGIYIAFKIGRLMLFIQGNPEKTWQNIYTATTRFVVVMAILAGSNAYDDVFGPYLVQPTIGIAAELGNQLGTLTANAFGASATRGSCNFTPPQVQQDFADSATALIANVCSLHLKMMGAVKNIGSSILKFQSSAIGIPAMIVGAILMIVALTSMVALVLSLATTALQLVEGILRMAFCATFLPFAAFMWVFEKEYLSKFLKNILYGGALIVVLSIISGITLAITEKMLQIAGNPSVLGTGSSQIGPTIKYVIVTLAMGTIATSLLSLSATIATKITDASGDAAEVAGHGVQAVSQTLMTGISVGGLAASTAGMAAGSVARSGLGALTQRLNPTDLVKQMGKIVRP